MPADTRGILAPTRMFRNVDFRRHPAPVALGGLVDWLWSVHWDFPVGRVHRQQLVAQPGVNVSVGTAPPPGEHPPPGPYPLTAVVNGVATRLTSRTLTGAGWNLAAKTSTGGFGAWVDDVQALTDRYLPASGILPGALAGVTPRTLQRSFASCAGVGPTWVIRRFRLIDAAERVRDGADPDWAGLAAELGYADQAHLTRDFTETLGRPPTAYARLCRDGAQVGWADPRRWNGGGGTAEGPAGMPTGPSEDD